SPMVCWRWANVLSGAGLICDLVRSSSLIDHTWIVDRTTGSCNERQPAGRAACSWQPIANVGFKETTLHTRLSASGRNRRTSHVVGRPGQGLLTEPTPVARHRARELVFMPQRRRLPAPPRMAQFDLSLSF